MNEEMAREELDWWIKPDNSLASLAPYVGWSPGDDPDRGITLDGDDFTIEELEAIAWWMRNKNFSSTESPATSDPAP